MARTANTLNYRRASTNYSCRSYTYNHPLANFGVAFKASSGNCYMEIVSPSSAYASHLRINMLGSTYALARLSTEYKPTWSPFLSVTHPAWSATYTQTTSTTFDYDQVYSSSAANNLMIVIANEGYTQASYTIGSTTYTVPLVTGNNYFYHRLGTPGAGNGISNSITIYAQYFVSPGPDPDPPIYYDTTAYRVEP